MKAGRYYELLSKIDTDISIDEKIKKGLREYPYNDFKVQKNKLDAKTDKKGYIYSRRTRNPLLRILSKVSNLRQALPSLAFLILLTLSLFGLVMGDSPSDSDEVSVYKVSDTPDDIHYVITDNNAEAVNTCTDYYKNDTYSEDLTIYLKYNTSKVESLFIRSLGSVDEMSYDVEGNIITIRKEYLDTLPEGLYKLDINMDRGNPATAQFTVHPEEEESEYGFYRLSNYYWDFYLSDPKDFTFLVFNRKDASITGLRNGSVEIDPEYYELDENGYTATLYQSYMAGMEEGVRFDLTVEFSDGMEKTIGIKIRYKEVNPPVLDSPYYIFDKSRPEDVIIKITWNDAKYITAIDAETHYSVGLGINDYTLEDDIFTIKKEFLESLEAGEYIWYLMFDTETGGDIRVQVND